MKIFRGTNWEGTELFHESYSLMTLMLTMRLKIFDKPHSAKTIFSTKIVRYEDTIVTIQIDMSLRPGMYYIDKDGDEEALKDLHGELPLGCFRKNSCISGLRDLPV